MDSSVKLVWITPEIEPLLAYMARVSNPANQNNPKYSFLIKFLINEKHWSPFEMCNACFEINTSRRISPQILRHKSFSFQEFSQRYAAVEEFVDVNPRRQDLKNRQSSHDDLPEEIKNQFKIKKEEIESLVSASYQWSLDNEIAKESAAFLLPSTAKSKLYMNGNLRSWIHYVNIRTQESTQLEHREIAQEIKNQLITLLPNVAIATGWSEESN